MTLINDAENLLLHQFSNSQRMKGLIRVLVTPFQEALSELEKLHHGHYIEHAADDTLDVIGAIVGQPRNGMTDDDYRPWLKVAICFNNSAGTTEDILNIIGILYKGPAPVKIQEYPPNAVTFILDHPPFPQETIKPIIQRAAPVTTACTFSFKRPASTNSDVGVNSLESLAALAPFQFDNTPFDKSYFLDFA